MALLIVEVLAPALISGGLPRAAESAGRRPAASPGHPGSVDAYHLLRVLDRLREQFGARIAVHLIEPLSLAWLVRVVRHRPARYPAFILAGREVVVGLDEDEVARRVARLLGQGVPQAIVEDPGSSKGRGHS